MLQLEAARQQIEVEKNLKLVMEKAKESVTAELEHVRKQLESQQESYDKLEARQIASVESLTQELERLKKKLKKKKEDYRALKKKVKEDLKALESNRVYILFSYSQMLKINCHPSQKNWKNFRRKTNNCKKSQPS